MSKIFAGISLLILMSCMQTEESILIKHAELSISVDKADFNALKSWDLGGVPECHDLTMDYVLFTLEFLDDDGNVTSSQQYKTSIFQPNGKLVTESVKILLNDRVSLNVRLATFFIYHKKADGDDVIVKAAPLPGSKYHSLVSHGLGSNIELKKFSKKEIEVDVLCFEPLYIVEFGFTWINLNEIIIRNQCWMANLCVDNPSDYRGSLYEILNNELSNQMPAILKINVLNYVGEAEGDHDDDINWDLLITHENNTIETYGINKCLEVFWPDNIDRNDLFRFDIYVLMADGAGQFYYQFYNSYAFWDNDRPDFGTDGIANFDIGDCTTRIFNACTLTQGFWKNHTGINKKTGQPYWGAINPDDTFLNSGLSYLQVFNKKPSESKYYILAHQYIATMLNVEVRGVDLKLCPEVQTQYDAAKQLLANYKPDEDLSSINDDLIYYAETLDLFNNGVLCTKHCD
jgi:hypothetical protein